MAFLMLKTRIREIRLGNELARIIRENDSARCSMCLLLFFTDMSLKSIFMAFVLIQGMAMCEFPRVRRIHAKFISSFYR